MLEKRCLIVREVKSVSCQRCKNISNEELNNAIKILEKFKGIHNIFRGESVNVSFVISSVGVINLLGVNLNNENLLSESSDESFNSIRFKEVNIKERDLYLYKDTYIG